MAGLRILVIEDHAASREFLAAALTAAGCTVHAPVGDLQAAVAAMQQLPVDLVLLDRVLRGAEAFPIVDLAAQRGVRCLLMSGYPRSSLPEPYRDVAFIEKPFTVDTLVAAVLAAARRLR